MQDIMQLPLHKIFLANGYRIDRNKSSMNYPCLTNDNGEHIIVSKKENNYLYFNPQNDTDRGNIFLFASLEISISTIWLKTSIIILK